MGQQKSFQPKDGPPTGDGRNFHSQQRRNDTHQLRTDPDAKLYRCTHQGEARLSYLGHVLVENRHCLVVAVMATQADGTAERDAAMLVLKARCRQAPGRRRRGAADKDCDTPDFVQVVRELGATRMSRRTHAARAATRSIAAPRGMPATRKVRRVGPASNAFSGGSRAWRNCGR